MRLSAGTGVQLRYISVSLHFKAGSRAVPAKRPLGRETIQESERADVGVRPGV